MRVCVKVCVCGTPDLPLDIFSNTVGLNLLWLFMVLCGYVDYIYIYTHTHALTPRPLRLATEVLT